MTIELVELEHPAVESPAPQDEGSSRNRWIALGAVLAVWVVIGTVLSGRNTQDLPNAELTGFQTWLTDLYGNLQDAKFNGVSPTLARVQAPAATYAAAVDRVISHLRIAAGAGGDRRHNGARHHHIAAGLGGGSADAAPVAVGPCGSCGHPGGPGSCALN